MKEVRKAPPISRRIEPTEAEISSAASWINHLVGEGFLKHDEDWLKAWYRHNLKWSTSIPKHVTVPRKSLEPLLKEAELKGGVFDLVRSIVESKHAAGIELARPLATFSTKVETETLSRPPGTPGRKSKWGRDFIIIDAMKSVMRGDPDDASTWLHPLANREQSGIRKSAASASEIIEIALRRTSIDGMTRRSISRVWERSCKQEGHKEAKAFYLGGILDDLDDLGRV